MKRLKTKDLKVFFVYAIILFILLLLVLTFSYVLHSKPRHIITVRVFILIEYALISLVFYFNLKNRVVKVTLKFLLIAFFAFSIYDYMQSINYGFSFIPVIVECILFIFLIIYYFFEKLNVTNPTPIFKSTISWIAVAFLIYSSGNFFLFLFSKNAIQDTNFLTQYALIYSTFTILKNIFICIGLSLKTSIDNSVINSIANNKTSWDLPPTINKTNRPDFK